VNSVGQSTLMRIPVKPDGSAGPIAKLEPSRPMMGPDGMRSVGAKTMLLVEGGRLDEVTINGDKAEIKVLKEGMPGITAVTLVGNTAYVSRGATERPRFARRSRPVQGAQRPLPRTQVGPDLVEAAAKAGQVRQCEAFSPSICAMRIGGGFPMAAGRVLVVVLTAIC
jgi:hypothetical protein